MLKIAIFRPEFADGFIQNHNFSKMHPLLAGSIH